MQLMSSISAAMLLELELKHTHAGQHLPRSPIGVKLLPCD